MSITIHDKFIYKKIFALKIGSHIIMVMDGWISVLYSISLALILLIAAPRMLYNWIVHKKYRRSLLFRLGLKDQKVKKSSPILIWIHAVSVGETKAVSKLARMLKDQYLDRCQLVVSSVTETGFDEAQRSLPFADHHIYLPFDFAFCIRPLVKKLSPNLVILCESDLWYHFLKCVKQQGGSIALVNGKISERSTRRFKWIPFFTKRLLALFDKICLQNELYRTKFIELGANPDKTICTGNLKFDEEYSYLSDSEIKEWKIKLGIYAHNLVLTIGSTHESEEFLILNALKEIWKRNRNVKVLFAPRHPERFNAMADLLEKEKVVYMRYSQLAHVTGHEQLILVDAMGILRTCYQLCDSAVVGGSFVCHIGGHNILEPCRYGKPVIFGPYMHAQTELRDLVVQWDAGKQVKVEELKLTLENWLEDKLEWQMRGIRGKELSDSLNGSTERTFTAILPLLDVVGN